MKLEALESNSTVLTIRHLEFLEGNCWPSSHTIGSRGVAAVAAVYIHVAEGSSIGDQEAGRPDIFKRKFTSRSKLSPENIAFFRLTAPGSGRMLKGWPELLIIFRLQPNRPGIKLKVGDHWHFRVHKQYLARKYARIFVRGHNLFRSELRASRNR